MADEQNFISFMKKIQVGERTARQLWDNQIEDARGLVSYEKDELKDLTNDRMLLNIIFPVLKQGALEIAMAEDCNEQAYKILMASRKKQEPEPMEQGTVDSDATAIGGGGQQGSYVAPRTTGPPPNQHYSSNDNSKSGPRQVHNEINFVGGNFQNTVVGSHAPVTFDNRGATITYNTNNVWSGVEARKHAVSSTRFSFKGIEFLTGDMNFKNNSEFWIDGVNVAGVTRDVFKNRLKDPNVYPIHTWGKSRALIINNYKFESGVGNRNGGERDSENMKELLTQLGFKVNVQNNKKAAEVKQLLHEFTRSKENMGIGMTMVFIGSHGERQDGKDYFLGVDKERVCVDEVSNYFTEKNCALLKDKPKLFMFQFCRIPSRPTQETAPNKKPLSSVSSDAIPFDTESEMDKPLGIISKLFNLNNSLLFGYQNVVPVKKICFLAFETPGVYSDARPMVPSPATAQTQSGVRQEVRPTQMESFTQEEVEKRESGLENPLYYKDMHFSFSTAPGAKSYRDRQDGTWFVTCVVKVFSANSSNEDYASMLTMVNSEVSAKKAQERGVTENQGIAVQLCQSIPYLSKKVYFFPKGK